MVCQVLGLFSVHITMVRTFMEETIHGFLTLTKVSSLFCFVIYNAVIYLLLTDNVFGGTGGPKMTSTL
jgi:hypothetical protein